MLIYATECIGSSYSRDKIYYNNCKSQVYSTAYVGALVFVKTGNIVRYFCFCVLIYAVVVVVVVVAAAAAVAAINKLVTNDEELKTSRNI